jgi:hypothetical protein
VVLVLLQITQGHVAELVLDQPEPAADLVDIVDILVMVPPEQVAAEQAGMPVPAEKVAHGTASAALRAQVVVAAAVLVVQDNILVEAAALAFLGKAVVEPAAYGLQITHVEVVEDLVEVLVLLLQ